MEPKKKTIKLKTTEVDKMLSTKLKYKKIIDNGIWSVYDKENRRISFNNSSDFLRKSILITDKNTNTVLTLTPREIEIIYLKCKELDMMR